MFWRRSRPEEEEEKEEQVTLEYPDLAEFDNYITLMIKSFYLKEGSYTFIACYGGILLYIRNQGFSWIPYAKVKDVMKKVDKTELTTQSVSKSVFFGSLAVAKAAHVYALPIAIVAERSFMGAYNVYTDPPPKEQITYLSGLISKVEFKKIKLKRLARISQSVPQNLESELTGFGLQIKFKQKFLDEIVKNRMEKFSDNLRNFIFGSRVAKFTVPIEMDLRQFFKALELDEIQTKFEEVTKQELIALYEQLSTYNDDTLDESNN